MARRSVVDCCTLDLLQSVQCASPVSYVLACPGSSALVETRPVERGSARPQHDPYQRTSQSLAFCAHSTQLLLISLRPEPLHHVL